MLLPVIQTWAEWGAVFTRVDVWTPAVQAICRREKLPCQQIEAGYPGTNAVFIVDRRYVVKIYAPFCHGDFDLERVLYPAIAQCTHIPTPRLLTQGVLSDEVDWPYIIISWLPGRPIREVRQHISPRRQAGLAHSLGEMIAELHAVPLEQIKGSGLQEQNWATWVQKRFARCVEDIRREGILPESVLAEIPAALAQVSTDGEPLMLLNGDLTEDHLLLEEQEGGWRISGLIDLGDALIGCRAYEWTALWFGALNMNQDCFRSFMQGYDPAIALDEAFFQQAMGWTLLHEFAAGILSTALGQLRQPDIRSLSDLRRVLWPSPVC